MAGLSAKVTERVKISLKRFQPILQSAKARDVNESDTVVIVTDMLEHIFGYDKYTEITSEYAIRGTYCDLAIKLDGQLSFLLEVKAIGLDLKDQHVKQAVDYAANQGLEWVGLTNGINWRIYKVSFGKPITAEVVIDMNILDLSIKDQNHIELVGLLTKEGWKKAGLEQHHSFQQVLNRFTVGAVLMTEPVVDCIKRELRRLSPETKIYEEDIRALLQNDVVKREIYEGEKAMIAQKEIAKAEKKALRKKETAKAQKAEAEEQSESVFIPLVVAQN